MSHERQHGLVLRPSHHPSNFDWTLGRPGNDVNIGENIVYIITSPTENFIYIYTLYQWFLACNFTNILLQIYIII